MASMPSPFLELLRDPCPICLESFELEIYPSVPANNETIYFFLGCLTHPCHLKCVCDYFSCLESSYVNEIVASADPASLANHPLITAGCPLCRAPLGDLGGVMLTAMYPPLPEEVPPAEGDAPACCGHAFLAREFYVKLSCGHSIHSRCLLHSMIGDYRWRSMNPPVPNRAICPQCQTPATWFDTKMIR